MVVSGHPEGPDLLMSDGTSPEDEVPMADASEEPNLQADVVRGGKNLLIRQTVGLVISGVGSIAIARLIGLRGYGSYAAVFEVTFFIQAMLEFNLDLFLVRRSSVDNEVYH